MSFWVWFSACLPMYLAVAGYSRNFFHTRPGHNQGRCKDWSDPPCWMWGGLLWPAPGIVWILSLPWKFGMHLEQQRPVHRAERREVERKKDLRAIS